MKRKILVVDDETDTAELLRYHLAKENYRVLVAGNGEDALHAVPKFGPDLILLDIMLPEMNGWDVCRLLRQSAIGKMLPIIMLTALSDEEARLKGLTLGADDYLSKPYSMQELLLKIDRLVGRQQTVKQLADAVNGNDAAWQYMVHELKNSLHVIGGYSFSALRKDDANGFMKTINSVASHAVSLLDNVAFINELEKGSVALNRENLDLNEVAQEVVDFVQDSARQASVTISLIKAGPSRIHANKTAVRQILINLFSNAIKYNRGGGRVWIVIQTAGGWVDLTVRDEGEGIAGADEKHIFEKYYRAPGHARIKGAGLGLYIVKLLVENLEGKVSVTSHAGAGSAFTVSFLKTQAEIQNERRSIAS
jgi:signal transduction histidine kinase